MIYFDSAATSMPKPQQVKDAIMFALEHCGNPSRGANKAALTGLRTLLSARQATAEIFNVEKIEDVAFAQNATAALNIAINGVRGHIVTTQAEHNSVLRPVYRQGNYTIVPVDERGRLDMNQLEAAIRPDTEAVVMTHASNLTGNVFCLETASEICQRKGVHLIVDAAQSAGLINLDMQKLKLSAVCFSGHKSLYGPQGTGGVCLGQGFYPGPLVVGGSGFGSFLQQHPADMPDRLEAGTQNAHGLAGLAAGIRYVQAQNGGCFEAADGLARQFAKGVETLGAYQLYGDLSAGVRTPVVALNHKRIDSAELAHRLHSIYSIGVRAGAHCAPLMHKAMGTQATGAVRFSFSHFNTSDEVAFALEALAAIDKAG